MFLQQGAAGWWENVVIQGFLQKCREPKSGDLSDGGFTGDSFQNLSQFGDATFFNFLTFLFESQYFLMEHFSLLVSICLLSTSGYRYYWLLAAGCHACLSQTILHRALLVHSLLLSNGLAFPCLFYYSLYLNHDGCFQFRPSNYMREVIRA